MSSVSRVLSGYRRLFRARQSLFQGDDRAMRESRVAIRAEFDKNLQVTEGAHLEELITMIDEAEDMLLHGVARGELNPHTGRYEVKIKPEHMQGSSDLKVERISPTIAKNLSQPLKVEVTKSKNDK
jgi:complex III assembly factor LYRM7